MGSTSKLVGLGWPADDKVVIRGQAHGGSGRTEGARVQCGSARACVESVRVEERAAQRRRRRRHGGVRRRRMAGMPWRAVGCLWETESARCLESERAAKANKRPLPRSARSKLTATDRNGRQSSQRSRGVINARRGNLGACSSNRTEVGPWMQDIEVGPGSLVAEVKLVDHK